MNFWFSPTQAAFYLALLGLGFAVLTVILRNMVHCALSLAGTLFCVAGLYLTLQADLLAGFQVLIYVGAVITLLLIAIMLIHGLTDRRIAQMNNKVGWGLVAGGGLAALLIFALSSARWPLRPMEGLVQVNLYEQLVALGRTLLSTYLLPFEVASLVLLVAMVGAILMAKEEEPEPEER